MFLLPRGSRLAQSEAPFTSHTSLSSLRKARSPLLLSGERAFLRVTLVGIFRANIGSLTTVESGINRENCIPLDLLCFPEFQSLVMFPDDMQDLLRFCILCSDDGSDHLFLLTRMLSLVAQRRYITGVKRRYFLDVNHCRKSID